MAAPPRQGVISLAIKDKAMLHSNFMPFVKSGGIFIPTERSFEPVSYTHLDVYKRQT